MKRFVSIGVAALALSACVSAPPAKYTWGNYETAMYSYYKNPNSADQFMVTLAATIKKGESQNTMAPGLYAEYGYMLMLQGKSQDAVANFEKEKGKWPESTLLMDRMIKMAALQPAASGGAK
jgi:hypothetical protein